MPSILQRLSSYAKQLPIFWSIGAAEPLVDIRSAREGVEFLETQLGFTVSSGPVADLAPVPTGIVFKVCRGMGGATDEEEVNYLTTWLDNLCRNEMTRNLGRL